MNKNRLIFYAIFAAFHLCAFIFTIVIENSSSMLFSMVKYISWFKYGTLLGLILVIIDVIWSWIINRDTGKQKAALTQELNTLKAKLFDLQETSRQSPAPPPAKS
jgi:ABC-type transport system involved in cytochrome bd biosynthesis fused ATPase/permease subunit